MKFGGAFWAVASELSDASMQKLIALPKRNRSLDANTDMVSSKTMAACNLGA